MHGMVYVLGGAQTDFARNWTRENKEIVDLMGEAVSKSLAAVSIEPREIETAHIGNFAAELFCGQGLLGGVFAALDPAFNGLPIGRHEAACASGSTALLAAASEIEAGYYDVACVLGVEMMRNVPGKIASDFLGAAAWRGHEFADATYIWPRAFSDLFEAYDKRYGLNYKHLGGIAEINIANARKNPNAQTRGWRFTDRSFVEDDEANPVVEGHIRRNDCGQVSDGAAAVILASRGYAESWARERDIPLENIPAIRGWGYRTATIRLADKLAEGTRGEYVLPHVRGAITDAFRRAELPGVEALDCIEAHDCTAMTEYLAIDHFGITPSGQSWRAVEDGSIKIGGRIPVNPSGGLIGIGHPVGATGVRMMLDAWRQVTGNAGDYQVDGAKTAATLNIGGSGTTTVSFILSQQ